MSILLQICPADLKRELLPQQHLFPKYEALRNHIIGLIHSRTSGTAPMIYHLENAGSTGDDQTVEGEDGELYRLERKDGKTRVFRAAAGGRPPRTGRKCYRCGREGHIRPDCTAKSHVDGGPPRAAPRSKAAGALEAEATTRSASEPNLGLRAV